MSVPVTRRAVVIRPPRGWPSPGLAELWAYRELLGVLAARELKVHYKQTTLGVLWAVLPPLMLVAVFNLLFTTLAIAPAPTGVPYVLATFCAMVPWQFFTNALAKAGNSLVQYRPLITKVYFPRMLAPLSLVAAALPELLLALLALAGMIAVYHFLGAFTFHLSWRLLALIPLTLLTVLAVVALALSAAALNAVYRDFQYLLRFALQFLFFLTPVLYPAERLLAGQPGWVVALYGLNPMAGVVEGFRWAVFGVGGEVTGALALLATGSTGALLLVGLVTFRRMERLLADLV